MHWLYLTVAILSEVVATSALKAAEGLSRWGPVALVLAGYGLAFYFLSLTLRTIPLGIAYAIWALGRYDRPDFPRSGDLHDQHRQESAPGPDAA